MDESSLRSIRHEVALSAATRGQANDEIAPAIAAIKQSVAQSGALDHSKVEEPDKGSIKVTLELKNFRSQLTGLLRQGMHGPGGPRFAFLITSDEYIPTLVAAETTGDKVAGCTFAGSIVFYSVIVMVGIYLFARATGYIVLSSYYLVIIGILSVITGGILAGAINTFIGKRALKAAVRDDGVHTGLAQWQRILGDTLRALEDYEVIS